MNDSWWESVMSGFFGGTQLHGTRYKKLYLTSGDKYEHSSLLSHALLGTILSEVSTTLKLSPRLSFVPIQLQVYILELLHSHFIKLQPRLDSKRNRRWRRLETKPVEITTHRCQPSRIRRDSPAFSSDVPRPAKWDRCPAFLENCIIIFFAAIFFTFLPCNAKKWRTSNTVWSILCTPTDAVYISRVAAVINDCFIF